MTQPLAIYTKLSCPHGETRVPMKSSGASKPITIRGVRRVEYLFTCPVCGRPAWVQLRDRSDEKVMEDGEDEDTERRPEDDDEEAVGEGGSGVEGTEHRTGESVEEVAEQ